MAAPKGAPVSPPSTISSTALMYDESSEARKSTALARSSGSPQRASGTVEEKKSETFADSSAVALAGAPRFQMGVFVAPGGHHVHANLARCKVCGDGSCHRDESAFRGSVGSQAWLTEITLHRSVEDDAAVVVHERSG